MAEEKKLEVFPIGITAKEIVKVVEEAGISGGGSSEITADNIDSGEATNGQVLTADGSGGCAWADASGGGSGGTQLYRHSVVSNGGTTPAMIIISTSSNRIGISQEETVSYNEILSITFYQSDGYVFGTYTSQNIGFNTIGVVYYTVDAQNGTLSRQQLTITGSGFTDTVSTL